MSEALVGSRESHGGRRASLQPVAGHAITDGPDHDLFQRDRSDDAQRIIRITNTTMNTSRKQRK